MSSRPTRNISSRFYNSLSNETISKHLRQELERWLGGERTCYMFRGVRVQISPYTWQLTACNSVPRNLFWPPQAGARMWCTNQRTCKHPSVQIWGTGYIVQWLRALAGCAEHLRLIPNTLMVAHKHVVCFIFIF